MASVDLSSKPASELVLAGLAARTAFGTDIEGLLAAFESQGNELTEENFAGLVLIGEVLSRPPKPALRLVSRDNALR